MHNNTRHEQLCSRSGQRPFLHLAQQLSLASAHDYGRYPGNRRVAFILLGIFVRVVFGLHGEGWHNNHHTRTRLPRATVWHGRYEFDPSWLLLKVLGRVCIAKSIKVAKIAEEAPVLQEAA